MAAYPQSLFCMSGEGSRWGGCRTSKNRDSQTSGRVYKANLESQVFHMESQLNQAIARYKACSHRSSYIEPLPNLTGGFLENIALFRAAMDSPRIIINWQRIEAHTYKSEIK